ncbi:MAG: NADH:flavin oxidoreductase [Deltaproteobacteria bacterium]|nr:NADH:flavin oxidoreductase [Deltaproteobacteria bacterium]
MSCLFESIMLADVKIKNRFVHAATHEAMAADDGSITDDIVRRYTRLAKGDVGLIIPGHLYVHPLGRAHNRQSGIHTDAMIPGLKKLADAVHAHGGTIGFQLAHGGRQSPRRILGQAPLAPSSRGRDPVSLNKPVSMDEHQILESIEAFAAAAKRAHQAGADAVQIHAAHGYLINEFLSPYFNHRKDSWGGSEAGRFRFLEAIVTRVQKAVPDGVPVLVKLNTNDFTPRNGITPDLAATYAKWLVELGVAAIEVSCGTYYGFQTIRGDIPGAELVRALPAWMRPVARLKMKMQGPANRFKEAYNLDAALTIRPVMKGVPLILVGGMRRLSQMEKTVSRGVADMISMSRPFIREPSLVRRFSEGKATEAACISCNRCFAAMFNTIPVRCYQKGRPQNG